MNINKININQSEQTYYIESAIYDVTANNNGATFESLSALLSDENLSTLIPTEVRCGGMTIRFVQSSDNIYVQYFLTKNEWSVIKADWQKLNLEEELTESRGKIGEISVKEISTTSGVDTTGSLFSFDSIGLLPNDSYYVSVEGNGTWNVRLYKDGVNVKVLKNSMSASDAPIEFIADFEKYDSIGGSCSNKGLILNIKNSKTIIEKIQDEEKKNETLFKQIDSYTSFSVASTTDGKYFTCNIDGYNIKEGSRLLVQMPNVAINGMAFLNISDTGNIPLMFNSRRASNTNTWVNNKDEVLEVYYHSGSYYATRFKYAFASQVININLLYGDYTSRYTLLEAAALVPESLRYPGTAITYRPSNSNTIDAVIAIFGSASYKSEWLKENSWIVFNSYTNTDNIKKNQGIANANKILIVGEDGYITLAEQSEKGNLNGYYKETISQKIFVGNNLISSAPVNKGAGWSDDVISGYYHSDGTETLVIDYETVSGKSYIVEFSTATDGGGVAPEDAILVNVGDLPKIDPYNGSEHVRIGVRSNGGEITFTPTANWKGRVYDIQLREIVEKDDAVEEYIINQLNIGNGSMINNITGFWNVALGNEALRNNVDGNRNVAIGRVALSSLITGTRNIGIGTFAGYVLVSGRRNIAIGADAFWSAKSGDENVVIGYNALGKVINNALRNIAIGNKSLGGNGNIQDSVAIGHLAIFGPNENNCQRSVAVGVEAGYHSGDDNTYIGFRAGHYNYGNGNVCVGSLSGKQTSTQMNYCVLVGKDAKIDDSLSGKVRNSVVIGNGASANKSNQVVIGNNTTQEVVVAGKIIHFNDDGSVTWSVE